MERESKFEISVAGKLAFIVRGRRAAIGAGAGFDHHHVIQNQIGIVESRRALDNNGAGNYHPSGSVYAAFYGAGLGGGADAVGNGQGAAAIVPDAGAAAAVQRMVI